jgi:elongation factor P--(R)-beta-lysine ligase
VSEPCSRRETDRPSRAGRFLQAFSGIAKEHPPLPAPLQPSPWWRTDNHADRRPFLLARERIRAALRRWFEAQGFIEVETSALQVSPGNELHLHAFATDLTAADGTSRRLYLHTSPEFACKKLLAAGEQRLFTFAQVYRNRERGPWHHPVFTMLEWYRAREPYERLMEDCVAVLRIAAEAADTRTLCNGSKFADPFATPERMTVAEACSRYAGIDLLATLPAGGFPSRRPRAEGICPELAAAVTKAGIRVAEDDTWDDILSRILVERIEPQLGEGRPAILDEYPAQLAALARPKPGDPRVAERFELYVCGVELANAFGELTDPALQRQRLEAEMEEKARIYGERYPIDEDFLAALAHMPQASGAALGFDRLVMLATGASRIEQVVWTPVVEAGP